MSSELKIQQNIPLAPLTTFKIGGSAKFFVEVTNEEEIAEAISFASENKLKIFVLGGGSNVLVNDDGFGGLVVKLQITNYKLQIADNSIECGAGLSLSEAVKLAKENSLTGLEWAAGIPGTIGGAVFGNAGALGKWMEDVVESVKVLEITNDKYQITNLAYRQAGKTQISNVKILKNSDCEFEYKNSIFKQNPDLIILSCVLKLEKGNGEEIEKKTWEILERRSSGSHPNPKFPSAGSYFQNPTVKNKELIARFEKEKGVKCKDNKLPAGWLIDEVGLRGKKMGGAMVSEEHANFVVNSGGATAQDVVALSSFIKRAVRDELGVQLMEEVQYVGF